MLNTYMGYIFWCLIACHGVASAVRRLSSSSVQCGSLQAGSNHLDRSDLQLFKYSL